MERDLTIGEVAVRLGVGLETIRFYERKGLLEKVPKDASGYRRFDRDSVKRVRFIRRAKELGFTLSEIRELLELRVDSERTCDDVRVVVERKMEDVEARLRALRQIRAALDRMARLCATGSLDGSCPFLDALDHDE